MPVRSEAARPNCGLGDHSTGAVGRHGRSDILRDVIHDRSDSDDASREPETREDEPSDTSQPPRRRPVSGQAQFSAPMQNLSAAIKAQLPDLALIQSYVADTAPARQLVTDIQALQALFADAKKVQQQIGQFAQQIVPPAVSQLATDLARRTEFIQQFAGGVVFRLPDYRHWAEALTKCLPDNLRSVRDMGDAWDIALAEGIPFSWVPRPEIATALIDADSPQERLRILSERQADVLEDCDKVLAPLSGERATQCRSAVDALRRGSYGPAQSHASNIVDSIVLDLEVDHPRRVAVDLANRDISDFSFRIAAEMLTLRPLDRAFVEWWPQSGASVPDHFSRHATAHAVGRSGVFDPQYALIAVMLAASLVAQFERNLP